MSRSHIRWIILAFASVAVAALLVGCCCTQSETIYVEKPPPPADRDVHPPEAALAPDSVTLVEMKGVNFRIDAQLAMHIRSLRGRMEPMPGHEVVDFGNVESFVINIAKAEVGLTADDMRYLFERYVFGYEGAPLSLHAMSISDDGYLTQEGTLHKVVDIPFEMKAELSATDDGRIRLHPVSMEICNIPGKGLMDALGIDLENLLDLSEASGVDVAGNDLLIDATRILPPPAIRGRITDVRIEDDMVIQVFDSGERVELPQPGDAAAENYMFFWGSTLAFGKLYMVRSDLQIVDADPTDPFDFFMQRYMEQLVAGHSETMPDAGLVAVFPDYDDITPDGGGAAASE